MAESKIGKVVQVIGPVVDIKFDEASLPNIYNEIKIDMGDRELVVEVEQHICELYPTLKQSHLELQDFHIK